MSEVVKQGQEPKKERKIGSVNLSSNELPEIKDWAIKGEYEITLKVKMTSISEVDKWERDQYSNLSTKDVMARFDIVKAVSPKKEAAKKQRSEESRGRIKSNVSISLK